MNVQKKLGTVVAVFLLTASVQAQDLPDGAGKDLVLKVCTDCHPVTQVMDKKRTKQEWSDTVDKMAERGATATDAEFDAIVAYLVKYFGKESTPEKKN